VKAKLTKIYGTLAIGNPLDEKTLVGPLHSKMSVDIFTNGLVEIQK